MPPEKSLSFAQRLDFFRSEITCVLQDATMATPDSVSVRVNMLQSFLGECFTEAELRDSLIRKAVMTLTGSAVIGKVVPIPAEERLVWSNTSGP